MQCRNCGAAIADKALICYRCGTATAEAKYGAVPVRRRRSRTPVLIVLVVLALALLVAWYLLRSVPVHPGDRPVRAPDGLRIPAETRIVVRALTSSGAAAADPLSSIDR